MTRRPIHVIWHLIKREEEHLAYLRSLNIGAVGNWEWLEERSRLVRECQANIASLNRELFEAESAAHPGMLIDVAMYDRTDA